MLENNFWREKFKFRGFSTFIQKCEHRILGVHQVHNHPSWCIFCWSCQGIEQSTSLSLLKKKLSWKMELKLFCSSYPFRRNWIYQVCLLLWYWIFNLDKYFVSLMNDFLTHPLQGKYVSLHNRNSVTSSLIKE